MHRSRMSGMVLPCCSSSSRGLLGSRCLSTADAWLSVESSITNSGLMFGRIIPLNRLIGRTRPVGHESKPSNRVDAPTVGE